MNRSCKAKSNAQITRDKMRYDQYHVAKRLTRSQTLQNEETESARGVNYTEIQVSQKTILSVPLKLMTQLLTMSDRSRIIVFVSHLPHLYPNISHLKIIYDNKLV